MTLNKHKIGSLEDLSHAHKHWAVGRTGRLAYARVYLVVILVRLGLLLSAYD